MLALIWALEMQPSQGSERESGRVHGTGGLGVREAAGRACCRKAVIEGVTRGSGCLYFLFVIVVKRT